MTQLLLIPWMQTAAKGKLTGFSIHWCLLGGMISSQPFGDESDNVRLSRQLNFGECCPCPGLPTETRSRDSFYDPLLEVEDKCDCPCRSRSDSAGSPSMLFPTRLQPKTNNEKEETRNLLEPEVGLASSVLETLREVTEDEYQDALARDAARARTTGESLLRDAVPEESSRNIVTVLVTPDEVQNDIVQSESSHVQESRCIQPLGRSLGKIKLLPTNPINAVSEILNIPNNRPVKLLHNNLLDIDSYGGASNVIGNFVKPERQILPDLSFGTNRANDINKVLSQTPKSVQTEQSYMHNNDNKKDEYNDPNFATTNAREQFWGEQDSNIKPKSRIPIENSLEAMNAITKKNIITSKNIGMITPDKRNTLLSKLELPTILRRDRNKLFDLTEFLHGLTLNSEKDNIADDSGSSVKTDIIDSVPVTSNIIPENIDARECEVENIQSQTFETAPIMRKENILEPDIKDGVFSPSENNPIVIMNIKTNESDSDLRDALEDLEECDLESSDRRTQKELNNKAENRNELENNKEFIESSDRQSKITSEKLLQINNDKDYINSKITDHMNNFKSDKNDVLSSSNNINTLITQPQLEKDGEEALKTNDYSIEPKELSKADNKNWRNLLRSDKSTNIVTLRPVSETIESIKGSLKSKLDDIKQKSIYLAKPKVSKMDNIQGFNTSSLGIIEVFEPNQNLNTVQDNVSAETKTGDHVDVGDLEKLSNSILKLSNELEKQAKKSKIFSTADSLDNNENENGNLTKVIETNEITNTELVTENIVANQGDKNSCITEEEDTSRTGTGNEGFKNNPSEMDVGASEPVISTVLKRPFLVLKGNSESPISGETILESTNPLDIFNTNDSGNDNQVVGLPDLNDITKQLSSIFGTNDKDSRELSSESITDVTCKNDNKHNTGPIMSAEPSTINSQSKLAPLEDLSLELFQLKPLRTQPDILKTFRTKLKLPKNVDFKPMKLRSALNNKLGLQGVALSVGPDVKSKSRFAQPAIDNDLANILRSPLVNMPSLDDLSSTLRDNAETLLGRGRELFPNNLEFIPTIDELTENLRSHAKKTAKSLQQQVGSTFNIGKPNKLISDPLLKPNEIFERISSAREDLNDKLVGLRYDLKDRLENVFDQTRFMSSRIPIINSGDRNRNKNVQNLKNRKIRPKQLTTAESRVESLQNNNPMIKKSFQNGAVENANINHLSLKQYKPMHNVPVPKSIDVPKLEQTIKKPPVELLQRDSSFKITSEKPLRNNIKSFSIKEKQSAISTPHSILRKEINPFKDSKFRITFATTTQVPTSILKSRLSTTPVSSLRALNGMGRNIDLTKKSVSSSASKVNQSRFPAVKKLVRSEESFKNEDLRSKPSSLFNTEAGGNSEQVMRKPWSDVKWPKKLDESFLSQLRDAIIARKLNNEPLKRSGESDMLKSASKNTEVVSDGNLKENVKYKCRMICSRE